MYVYVPLRGPEVRVTRQLLCDETIAHVLRPARPELVVPDRLRSTEVVVSLAGGGNTDYLLYVQSTCTS